MPWVRLDDQFAEHPKVVKAGPLAMAMHVAALCYSSRNLTDGHIPRSVAKKLLDLDGLAFVTSQSGRDAEWGDIVDDLIDAGMWTETNDGYEIHDYLEFQPSRRQVEEKRADLHAKRSAAGRKGAKRRWQNTVPEPPGQDGKQGKSDDKPEASARQSDGPDPVPDPEPIEPRPPRETGRREQLPAERWARRWCELMNIPPTRSVLKFMIPKAQEYIADAGEPTEGLLKRAKAAGIRTPGGWGFISNPQKESVPDWLENHWKETHDT